MDRARVYSSSAAAAKVCADLATGAVDPCLDLAAPLIGLRSFRFHSYAKELSAEDPANNDLAVDAAAPFSPWGMQHGKSKNPRPDRWCGSFAGGSGPLKTDRSHADLAPGKSCKVKTDRIAQDMSCPPSVLDLAWGVLHRKKRLQGRD